MKLRSVEEEAKACRLAFKNSKVGDMAWHCHHETLVEQLNEPAENRIAYILAQKPESEQAIRLRLMRPVKSEAVAPARKTYDDAVASAWKTYNAAVAPAHSKECPGCPYDGSTIFA